MRDLGDTRAFSSAVSALGKTASTTRIARLVRGGGIENNVSYPPDLVRGLLRTRPVNLGQQLTLSLLVYYLLPAPLPLLFMSFLYVANISQKVVA
jgi:hypothetical protein